MWVQILALPSATCVSFLCVLGQGHTVALSPSQESRPGTSEAPSGWGESWQSSLQATRSWSSHCDDEVLTTLSRGHPGAKSFGRPSSRENSPSPFLHFNRDAGSFLPQAMKVLSKKKLIRQAGFPREFGGPHLCSLVQGWGMTEKISLNGVPCRVPG